ncbi:MAG: PaaI family thioesterase [Deltaproteobacteria bacterium]|nr:PaaI family thioesterase [Deltaproteobacteria bacterium]
MTEYQDDQTCFACGNRNPIGLHMKVEYGQDRAFCRLRIPSEYQGWSKVVHGGIIATLLDEIMAHAVLHFVGQGVTGSLNIRFRSKSPTEEPLDIIGWVDRIKRRVVEARGEIRLASDGTLLAQGESRFMLLPVQEFARTET